MSNEALNFHDRARAGKIEWIDIVDYFDSRMVTIRTWVIGVGSIVLGAIGGMYLLLATHDATNAEDLKNHTSNSAIHRTAQETSARDQADREWRERVERTLERIEEKEAQ